MDAPVAVSVGAVRSRPALRRLGTGIVAAAVFVVAYNGGGYSDISRGVITVVVLWALALALGLGLAGARLPRAAMATGGLLVAFALVNLVAAAWAPSVENAVNEFNRTMLYVAAFFLAAIAARRGGAAAVLNGLALAISAIVVLSLLSRFFPHTFGTDDLIAYGAAVRLSYPLNYWNGLAILATLGFPLLLRIAVTDERPMLVGAATAPMPLIACVVYLASSRGAAITAVVAIVAFLVLARRGWRTAGAIAVVSVASAIDVFLLHARSTLVNGPFPSAVATQQGHTVAPLLVIVSIVAAAVYAGGRVLLRDRFHPPRAAGAVLSAGVVVVALVLLIAAHPVRRFNEFRALPPSWQHSTNYVDAHLQTASSSGRWQQWAAAVDQFRAHPVLGQGPETYEAWWARHQTYALHVRDTHSLFLQALGELGLLGFAAITGAFVIGGVAAVRRGWRAAPVDAALGAAAAAAFLAFAVGCAIDWLWQLAAVGIAGVVLLGVALGGVPLSADTETAEPTKAGGRRLRIVQTALLAAVAAAIAAAAIPLIAQMKIQDSQDAVAAGNGGVALAAAKSGVSIEPWAASTHLQLALVDEQLGDLPRALREARSAVARDDADWSLWLVKARLETKLGQIAAARKSLHQAERLNPHSPLFASNGTG